MGKTIALFKVKPAEDIEPKDCIEQLKTCKKGEFADAKEEPIGFGIIIVKAAFLIPEKQDEAINELTEELNAMEKVDEAELEGLTLL